MGIPLRVETGARARSRRSTATGSPARSTRSATPASPPTSWPPCTWPRRRCRSRACRPPRGCSSSAAWSAEGAPDLGVHVAPAARRPEPGAPVRGRRRAARPVRAALPRRGAHRRPVPPRVPAGSLVPHRLRPPARRGAQLPARPHRGRGRRSTTGRRSTRPTTTVPGPGPGHLGARRRGARSSPACASTARRRSWAVQHVGPDHVVERGRRRLGRGRAPGHQPRRLPLLRALVPRARRDPRAARAARRPDRVAGGGRDAPARTAAPHAAPPGDGAVDRRPRRADARRGVRALRPHARRSWPPTSR